MSMKRFGYFLALLLVCLAVCAQGEGFDVVFDRSQDADCLTVRFIDLGPSEQDSPGDCTVITSPNGEYVMVIDAGKKESRDYVFRALQAMNIDHIDYLVVSHPHGDHTGNMPEIMDTIPVKNLITSPVVEETANNYKNYMAAMERNNIPHTIVSKGDVIPFGDVLVEVLWPEAVIEYPPDEYEGASFVNNHSLVMKFTYGESTYLTCGDLYMAGEKLVIDMYGDKLDVDVIKLSHHGKDTSSSSAWTKAVTAEVAVAEADTLYDVAMLKRFMRNGAQVYLTCLDGNIAIHMHADGTRTLVRERADETPLLKRKAQ